MARESVVVTNTSQVEHIFVTFIVPNIYRSLYQSEACQYALLPDKALVMLQTPTVCHSPTHFSLQVVACSPRSSLLAAGMEFPL